MLVGVFGGVAPANPFVHFGQLELPEPADSVSWECPALNPSVDGVLGHAEMLRDLVDRYPRFRGHVTGRGGSA